MGMNGLSSEDGEESVECSEGGGAGLFLSARRSTPRHSTGRQCHIVKLWSLRISRVYNVMRFLQMKARGSVLF